jgi:hypothetical protein
VLREAIRLGVAMRIGRARKLRKREQRQKELGASPVNSGPVPYLDALGAHRA